MNTPKHTPGPWQIQGLKITTEGALGYIALMGQSDTTVADARLIAEAPNLLHALIAMVDHAKEQYPHFESVRGQTDITLAETAIRRATR